MVTFKAQDETVIVLIGDREYLVARGRLGEYLELEQYYFVKNIRAYLRTAGVDTKEDDLGVEIIVAYAKIVLLNIIPVGIPLVDIIPQSSKDTILWHYDGRKAFAYIHLVASAYGWSREEILNLRVEEFFAYAQEILVDKQIEREIQHRLSKMSYEYDKTTHTLILRPMERPVWMLPIPKDLSTKIVPESMRPQGNIVTLGSQTR